MTTKEFQRKLAFYRGFLQAVQYFNKSDHPDSIWRFTLVYPHSYRYVYSDSLEIDFDTSVIQSIHAEKYFYQEYCVQINRYCVPFLKSCSEYQLDVIRQDPDLMIYLSFLAFE